MANTYWTIVKCSSGKTVKETHPIEDYGAAKIEAETIGKEAYKAGYQTVFHSTSGDFVELRGLELPRELDGH